MSGQSHRFGTLKIEAPCSTFNAFKSVLNRSKAKRRLVCERTIQGSPHQTAETISCRFNAASCYRRAFDSEQQASGIGMPVTTRATNNADNHVRSTQPT
jgi:hypothetical protein